MKHVVYGADQYVAEWVGKRINTTFIAPITGAIGLADSGALIAGVVYNYYTGASISMHVAATPGSRWMTRDYLYRCFAYPFVQLNCRRVTGLVRVDNLEAQRFDEHLGFQREGVLREAEEDGCDLIVYGMLKKDCRWLRLGDKR